MKNEMTWKRKSVWKIKIFGRMKSEKWEYSDEEIKTVDKLTHFPFFPSFSLMCSPSWHHLELRDPIWGDDWGIAFIDDLLVEVLRGFLSCKVNSKSLYTVLGIISLSSIALSGWHDTRTSGHWLETRTGDSDTLNLKLFLSAIHDFIDKRLEDTRNSNSVPYRHLFELGSPVTINSSFSSVIYLYSARFLQKRCKQKFRKYDIFCSIRSITIQSFKFFKVCLLSLFRKKIKLTYSKLLYCSQGKHFYYNQFCYSVHQIKSWFGSKIYLK